MSRARAALDRESPRMSIVVHDFAGHPFQVELSRELARRGHRVAHLYADEPGTTKGLVEPLPDDPDALTIAGIDIAHLDRRGDSAGRVRADRYYAGEVVRAVRHHDPEVILSANAPLLTQRALLREARSEGRRFVYWFQDSYGLGVRKILSRRSGPVGTVLGAPVVALERRLLARADAVVAISPAFADLAISWGVSPERLTTERNWAPLERATPADARRWLDHHGLDGSRVVLYAGTLGLKHDPALLTALADGVAHLDDVRVVVVSEGTGRSALESQQRLRSRPNLVLLDYEPAEAVPAMLAAATLTVVILDRAAGAFSVPSKVLSSLAAGRALVGAIPAENEAARVLEASGAGRRVDPEDGNGFVETALQLLSSPGQLDSMGAAGRHHAETTFELAAIASRFEAVLRPDPATPPVRPRRDVSGARRRTEPVPA